MGSRRTGERIASIAEHRKTIVRQFASAGAEGQAARWRLRQTPSSQDGRPRPFEDRGLPHDFDHRTFGARGGTRPSPQYDVETLVQLLLEPLGRELRRRLFDAVDR